MKPTLNIDVYFDLICPWCLIGKRHLSRALAEFVRAEPDVAVQVSWHGVQLIPQVPAQGWSFAEFYEQRLGGAEAVQQRQQQVQQAAAQAGLALDLSRIAVFPNSGRAHRLLQPVKHNAAAAQVDALIERLFAAYFMRGENIGDPAFLLQVARECGFDADSLLAELSADAALFTLADAPTPPQGVPYFVFDRRIAIAGAHPPATLLAALRETLLGNRVGKENAQ